MDKVETLNKLLEVVYKFGFDVGYCWYKEEEVCGVTGHLRNEKKYHEEILKLVKELAPCVGLKAEEVVVYMLQDRNMHCDDWDYIPPEIARKGEI